MTLSAGKMLGPYELIAPIRAGGMGEVYLARDPQLGRKLAIKLISSRMADDPDALARFAQEARSASALNHPNIVTIYEVAFDGDPAYIAMEYIEGKDLREVVSPGPLLLKKALDITAQIAEGLAAAHEHGIVHRDLKPENVMITRDGLVKLLDFGLAKLTIPEPDPEQKTAPMHRPETRPGMILGTVGYMSPEQAAGSELDFRSDQFSLGSILYELVTGRRAFEGKTTIDTLSAILHEDPQPVQNFNAKVPAPLQWILERCLAKDREERYASTRDLAHELRTVRDRLGDATLSGSGIRRPRLRLSRGRLLLIGSALAVGIALTIAAVVFRDRAAKPSLAAPEVAARGRSAVPQQKYLAVLPFDDLSGTREGQLLIDGLSETLSARLANLPNLQVMPPATSGKEKDAPIATMARNLGVNLVLRGAVQRIDDRIRVSFSILDPEKGTVIAGDTVTGPARELFSIQDQLADGIARALQIESPTSSLSGEITETASQDRYLQAIGYLQRYQDEASVDGAIGLLEPIADNSRSAIVHAALGRAYLYKYRLTHDKSWATKATLACGRAAAADSRLAEVHITLGELAMQTGRPDDAIDELQKAVAQQPTNADAVLTLAEAYRTAGRSKDAEESYRRAIALRPSYWGGYNKLAVFHLLQGHAQEAVAPLQKVISLTPDNTRGYNNLGAAYQQLGRYEEAIEVFRKSIELQPTSQAWSNLGTCYFFRQRYREAADAFEHATALTPGNSVFWSNLGDAYRWTPGMDQKAPAAYRKAIELARSDLEVNPRDASSRARIAVCLAKTGRLQEADGEMKAALAIDPDDIYNLYKAAIVANLQGDEAQAIRFLRRSLAGGYAVSEAQTDPELNNLRDDPKFEEVVRESQRTASGKQE